jgi:hypothetical protein
MTSGRNDQAVPGKGGVKVADKALAKTFGHRQGRHFARAGRLRLGVQGGGCSGLSYNIRFDTQPRGDRIFRSAMSAQDPKSHLSERHGPGLPGNSDAAGICVRQSECIEVVRLRNVILRVVCAWLCGCLCGRGRLARESLERQGSSRSALASPVQPLLFRRLEIPEIF